MRYADDTMLLAGSEADLRFLLAKVKEEGLMAKSQENKKILIIDEKEGVIGTWDVGSAEIAVA